MYLRTTFLSCFITFYTWQCMYCVVTLTNSDDNNVFSMFEAHFLPLYQLMAQLIAFIVRLSYLSVVAGYLGVLVGQSYAVLLSNAGGGGDSDRCVRLASHSQTRWRLIPGPLRWLY